MIDGNELDRVRLGPKSSESLMGLGTVRFVVDCPGNAETVLRNARQVMEVVLRYDPERWPSDSEWYSLLPAWFIEKCAPEMSREEAERSLEAWRKLSPEQQSESERSAAWSVPDWAYWMNPTQRQWAWWNASLLGPDQLIVAVAVNEWPFAWEALSWLFRASGGQKVVPIDEGKIEER